MEEANSEKNHATSLKVGKKEFSLVSQNIFEIKTESLLLLADMAIERDFNLKLIVLSPLFPFTTKKVFL